MDTNDTATPPVDSRLTEQLVVQETKAVRELITKLRQAYLIEDGELPSEAAAVRRLIRVGLPILFDRLGYDDVNVTGS